MSIMVADQIVEDDGIQEALQIDHWHGRNRSQQAKRLFQRYVTLTLVLHLLRNPEGLTEVFLVQASDRVHKGSD